MTFVSDSELLKRDEEIADDEGNFYNVGNNATFSSAYKSKLSELYYSVVMGEQKDMLIGPEGDITFFEIKIVPRRFAWDSKTQSFKKFIVGSTTRRFGRGKKSHEDVEQHEMAD